MALVDFYLGLSVHNGEVRVHLLDETTAEAERHAEQIVQNHDPTLLTIGQQTEITRRKNLVESRTENQQILDTVAYDGSDALMQQLARKLQWLEQEIRDLRGL
jgi:hypothetical protein